MALLALPLAAGLSLAWEELPSTELPYVLRAAGRDGAHIFEQLLPSLGCGCVGRGSTRRLR